MWETDSKLYKTITRPADHTSCGSRSWNGARILESSAKLQQRAACSNGVSKLVDSLASVQSVIHIETRIRTRLPRGPTTSRALGVGCIRGPWTNCKMNWTRSTSVFQHRRLAPIRGKFTTSRQSVVLTSTEWSPGSSGPCRPSRIRLTQSGNLAGRGWTRRAAVAP